ncbi:MAG: LLM class flavin-dependent oxidoreductase [Deltaproteobacteria bacterium]|nr:LLM class flavin-dependent oxidoreductase [Deltaproteobacteria bacterium]
MTTTFGVGLFPTEPLPKMIQLAKLSEELGYSHIWIGDSHLIWREAYVNLAAVAVNTSKVKLGTGVTNPLTRHPSVVSSAFVTLEEMAPRRVYVGIGLGDSSVETMGMKPARLADFEKTIHQMRALMRGEDVELETGKIHLNYPCKEPIPIYIAASGPKMLELAGRLADGVIILVGTDPAYLRNAMEKIEVGAKASGRELKDINLVLWVPCAVSEKLPAREVVKAHVARVVAHPLPFVRDKKEQEVLEEIRKAYNYYQHLDPKAGQGKVIPDWLVDKFAIAGTPEECRAKVQEIREIGIDQIAIIPYAVGDGDRGDTLKKFASAVF